VSDETCEASREVSEGRYAGTAKGHYRVLINGNLAERYVSLDDARKAASAMGRLRTASKSSSLRISVETAECEEVYVLVIINECADLSNR